jgi:DNA-binding NarL/FixJ family response regulator
MIKSAAEARLSKSMRAELTMTRAAVHAQAGNPGHALALIHRHRLLSKYLEPELLARWVRASCSVLAQKPKSRFLLRAAWQKTVSSGALDLLVFAYRLHPAILRGLADEADFHDVLDGVLRRAGDSQLARNAGVSLGTQSGSRTTETLLTNREREVYSHLAEGKTNREIAEILFISELTAKVHVRNVLRKLGVRTRTQAALKAFRDEPD